MNDKELFNNKIISKTARITVIGLGYVGLPTAVFFARNGFEVIGVDVDTRKIELINQGISPLKDLNLDEEVRSTVNAKKLSATNDATSAVKKSDVILIIVPTPVNEAKEPDLSFVISACESVATGIHKNCLVVLESTTFPGTTEEIMIPILERSGLIAGEDFGVAYCPERYNPGDSTHTLENVSRVVGGINEYWTDMTCKLYQNIILKTVKPVRNLKTAEAAKVIENIQRDLNIALMNELALIFEKMNIDIIDVIDAASTKWNFGKYSPGPGVGGHCLPVDPYYLTKKAQEYDYQAQVILAGRRVNDYMPVHVVELLQDGLNELGKPLKNSKILVFGASYKENTADLREAPSEKFVKETTKKGALITIVEPNIEKDTIFGCKNISLEAALKEKYDAYVYLVDHKQFSCLKSDPKLLSACKLLVDGKRSFNPEEIRGNKCIYKGVGAVN